MIRVPVKRSSQIIVDLDGSEGNVFRLMALAKNLSSQLNIPEVTSEMKEGDYLNALRVFELNFGCLVTLETKQSYILDFFENLSDVATLNRRVAENNLATFQF
jgi:hypothetical protein